jgi:hypothetical protein
MVLTIFYMEVKFGPTEERYKNTDIIWFEIFRNNGWEHTNLTSKEMENFGIFGIRTSWRETKKITTKLLDR